MTTDTGNVPKLFYDGCSIDVLYDYHEDAVQWYETHLGWKVEQQEDWLPDPRATQGKMTHMGRGAWLVSCVTNQRLPFHYAERGTVDSNIRICFKAKDLHHAHASFFEQGIRVSEIYAGPGGHQYFDAWLTAEGTRFTFQDEIANSPIAFPDGDNFRDTCIRIGVSNLEKSVEWYQRFVGMAVESEHIDDGYVVMSLGVNHHPDGKSKWVLETLPKNTYRGKIDGPLRPLCFVHNSDEFFNYHRFLQDHDVEVGDLGGFVDRGIAMFHFYDLDGNRFNVSSFV